MDSFYTRVYQCNLNTLIGVIIEGLKLFSCKQIRGLVNNILYNKIRMAAQLILHYFWCISVCISLNKMG